MEDMTTLPALAEKYHVKIDFWCCNGEIEPTPVTIIEMDDTKFVGWWTEGPYVGTIVIDDGEVYEKVVEF